MAAVLHEAWAERRRVVSSWPFRRGAPGPEGERRPPYELDPGFTFERERLQFLVWANNYDARKPGDPIWWHGVRASRIGADPRRPRRRPPPRRHARVVRRRPPPPGLPGSARP